jgi:3D (Asp-Asp-Asp) domain-containing protein
MLLARSFWLKAFVTTLTAVVFVWLLEATILDSKHSMLPLGFQTPSFGPPPPPAPGVRVDFSATAYCKGLVTTAGVAAQAGIAAADPSLLPIGSVVQLDAREDRYDGIYTVLDTGPAVQGRELDIYMWSCHEALKFGRRPVRLTVLRLGWSPRATTPTFMERLFRRPEPREPAVLPSRPLPIPYGT